MISCARRIAIISEGFMEYNFGILGFDAPELIIVLAIVLLLFGGKKLPELSRSLGNSMKELRKGMSDDVKSDKPSDDKARSQSAS
jgi:sec-independent protein translocase protein TatA